MTVPASGGPTVHEGIGWTVGRALRDAREQVEQTEGFPGWELVDVGVSYRMHPGWAGVVVCTLRVRETV